MKPEYDAVGRKLPEARQLHDAAALSEIVPR